MHGFARLSFLRTIVAPLLLIGFGLPTTPLRAQATAPADAAPTPPPPRTPLAYNELRGRTVEDVRVLGNTQVSTAIILNVVRTRAGDKFDPATVEEDYQRDVFAAERRLAVALRLAPHDEVVHLTLP